MLTYVINTSENKTFDSSKLFELAGYSKIRWVQCSLNDISRCVEHISEKQNSIIADDFRIAVIVDFYGFDKIRIPYGRRGFANDEGVDMSLYMPYIEVYLLDNLILKLESRDLYAKDFEIYYVQSEKSERYELFKSASVQIKQILNGSEGMRMPSDEELLLIADREITDKEAELALAKEQKKEKNISEDSLKQEDLGKETPLTASEIQIKRKDEISNKKVELLCERKTPDELAFYSSFRLYCTPSISLEFPLIDFPYGSLEMNFDEFWDAFRNRVSIKADLRRHYYVVPYGGGASRAALYTLSLSLYLIHLYEREESSVGEGDMDIERIDSYILRDVLENGWRKINAAKYVAVKNNTKYYSLADNSIIKNDLKHVEEIDPEEAILKEKAELSEEVTNTNMSSEMLYSEILEFAERDVLELKERNREEFDRIMTEYLKKRDETRESDIEAEFVELKNGGFLAMTEQCPSKEEYNHLVNEKQKQISELFESVLSAEYIDVDYSEEAKKAEKAFSEYKAAKAMTNRKIIGDIVFLLLTVASAVLPYCLLQLDFYSGNLVPSIILAIMSSCFFAGLFTLSVIFQLIPAIYKMNKARKVLRNLYIDCCAKERYSFSSIRRKYEKDLVDIENIRYEIRQIKRLFDENQQKEKNILLHRRMLDGLSDSLGSMLNNLDVEPTLNIVESVDGEFDISKSPYSKDNEVYKIFSMETIEKIFSGKGSEVK